jgi:hypothetical protein
MNRILVVLLLTSCEQSNHHQPPIVFAEIASSIAPTVCGAEDPTQIIEVNGTGLALFDFDNDDDLDLFVVNSSNEPCRLYENISDDSIAFKDVTETKGINLRRWANGVAIGDVNGDGFDDVYITCHGPNVLLINRGGKDFEDVTDSAGVGDTHWGTSARFGDLDGDGDLDLYVCNYLEYDFDNPPPKAKYKGQDVLGGPHGMRPQGDVVFENLGDVVFQNVTQQWGFVNDPAFSLNAAILDFNEDGLQDVFVGNDSMENQLYLNTGEIPTRFENMGVYSGVATNGDGSMQATMGIAVADVCGNNRPDIFTTNFSSDTNTLHVNDFSGYFDDRTKQYGLGLISRSLLGWSCAFHDFDLDGDEDLFIVNGHVYPNATMDTMDSTRKQSVLLLQRDGDRFVQVEQEGQYRDRAAVFGDLDNDGDTDVIVAQRSGEVRVLQNDSTLGFLQSIQLQGKAGNPKALGTKIVATFNDGTTATRWNTDGFGFQSSTSVTGHNFVKPINSLEITWPDGEKQTFQDVPSEDLILISE